MKLTLKSINLPQNVMDMENKSPSTVEEYIAGFPAEVQDIMRRVRASIHSVAPDVNEKISWAMPTFYIGRNRVHFAGHKKHLGFYPGVEPIEEFAEELKAYVTSKGGIQFPYSKPVPVELIAKIAKKVLSAK